MVAISLYKGNLHRTPDTPRQWLMPTGKLSPKDFKSLLQRRSKALSRLHSTSNPNPNSDDSVREQQPQSDGSLELIVNEVANNSNDNDDSLVIPSGELVVQEVADAEAVLPENDDSNAYVDGDQLAPPKDDTLSDKEKRKKEVEEKLQVLNERKHKLVQVLKQILHAEEELRRRSNVQGITGRPSVSLQVDVSNDSGSLSRHVTPRPGSEGGDVEGAYADDVSNQNMHSRNLTRMSSMSPSSDSLHRRGPFSMVPNPSRGSLGVVASSPSRFAPTPTGQQQGNLPTVSVTGTNYVASSPSPAGSGGTSVYRDAPTARLPSPWN